MAKKNKTILIIILLVAGFFVLNYFGFFGLFALTPITIDPTTCVPGELVTEKLLLSSEVNQVCFPHSWRYPTIQIGYGGKTGDYINILSGDQLVWGGIKSGEGILVRCYKCDSAQSIQGAVKTRVFSDNILPNPLSQSKAFASLCIVGQCMGGWECKSNNQGTYYEYTACNNAPPSPPRFCGNGILEIGETQDNCCKDAGCPSGYECINNACELIGLPPTPPQPPMPPTCGDGVCGPGEDWRNCCIDCGCLAGYLCMDNVCVQTSHSCGNGICEEGETCTNCPIDCGPCDCILEGEIDYIQCSEGFRERLWAKAQCLNLQWKPVEPAGKPCYCVSDYLCKENFKCSNNICVPNLPEFCVSTADCGLKGYYCDTTTRKCLVCQPGIPDCELGGFQCHSANDCFDISANFCANWICSAGNCMLSGIRYEGCCNNDLDCPSGHHCINNVCLEEIPEPKPKPSIFNLLITFLIIAAIGFGIFILYKHRGKLGIK